ncbi:MAG: ABC transporter permease [bacterium]|nr:ABC transporter permease [bacterium]
MVLFQIVWKNLLRRKVRSLLTVIGIGVGIGAVVSLVSITNGFVNGWKYLLEGHGIDLTILKAGNDANFIAHLMNLMDESLAGDIRGIPGVESVQVSLADMVSIEDKPSVMLFGYEPGGGMISRLKFISGRPPAFDDRDEIALGTSLAGALKAKIGDEIEVEREILTVVGICESSNLLEDGAGILSLRRLQKLMSREGKVTAFGVHLENPARLLQVKKAIEARLPGLSVMTTREAVDENVGTKMAQALSWGVSLIVLLVGAIATMNTMFMSVFERTREIGILRALGWKKGRIISMILQEAVILSLCGGVLGIFLGMGAVRMLNLFRQLQGLIRADYNVFLFSEAIILAVLLGILGGLLPAWRGARLPPVEALRYE